jgi:DNA-directed RNA polymerase specialized sigma24 family protein
VATHRAPTNPGQGIRIQSLILADYVGLPGAAAVVRRLNPLLLSFVRRQMGRLRPLEYRFTPEAIARGTWKVAFRKVGPAFWNASDEMDALTELYDELTGLAAKTLNEYKDRIFTRFREDHGKLVHNIAWSRGLGVPWNEREDVEQECWMRILRELPLSDIITRSEVEEFIGQKAFSAARDYGRKVRRRRVLIMFGLPDVEDADRDGSPDNFEVKDLLAVIAEACKDPLATAVLGLRLCGMTREEIAANLGVKPRRVKRAWEAVVRTAERLRLKIA